MTTVNHMIIPQIALRTRRDGTETWYPYVIDQDNNIIWTSPITTNNEERAWEIAEEAVGNIAYQRRHQLTLWQEHGIGQDPYLAP